MSAKVYEIRIKKDANFCGKDAGGVSFINGSAKVADGWLAQWYAQRPDIYEVRELKKAADEKK